MSGNSFWNIEERNGFIMLYRGKLYGKQFGHGITIPVAKALVAAITSTVADLESGSSVDELRAELAAQRVFLADVLAILYDERNLGGDENAIRKIENHIAAHV